MGIVIELQKQAIDTDSDVVSLLRKAYLVARKLDIKDFEEWINSELNGYTDYDKIPDYREIRGQVKAWNPYHGWIPVIIQEREYEISKKSFLNYRKHNFVYVRCFFCVYDDFGAFFAGK